MSWPGPTWLGAALRRPCIAGEKKKAEDIIGETERQIQADEDRREAEIAELVNEPFDTAITPEGHEIDMRPPVLRAKKAEKDYEYYVGNGQHDEAVQMLVVRLAFTKLHHGPESMRTVKALLTLANAYLDLCQLPKQALRHAKAARDVFRSIKDSVSLAAHASRALMLESRILLAIARATVKRYESDAGAGAKKKAEQVRLSFTRQRWTRAPHQAFFFLLRVVVRQRHRRGRAVGACAPVRLNEGVDVGVPSVPVRLSG